ncbi:PDC sensor domain-containing protein [Sulfurihydrogenibium subterraneum]|uniref:PDC sensor domain-containing protein n=1 Tax=Sulfurihydrogenibium subterraneum TaxID=171121 RepID=UPI00056D079B|nr:PDC sensor domain-containing protein [Sulfurihydrogenibium subterraneum]
MEKFELILSEMKNILCDELKNFVERYENYEDELFHENLFVSFPFIELFYVLDNAGIQIIDNVINPLYAKRITRFGKGADRSSRPYFLEAIKEKKCIVTKPYRSLSSSEVTATIAIPIKDENESIKKILCFDIDLIALLHSDKYFYAKDRFEKVTKVFYTIFSIFLGFISVKLALWGSLNLFVIDSNPEHIFKSVILFTLAIAIFDLSKTIFEEEVLLYKDPRRHSEIRKTLTRFLASIIIAISIEALMLVFKFTISDPSKLIYSIGIIVSVGFVLISLGIYVFLGTRSEISVKKFEKESKQ